MKLTVEAPALDWQTIEEFRSHPDLRRNMQA